MDSRYFKSNFFTTLYPLNAWQIKINLYCVVISLIHLQFSCWRLPMTGRRLLTEGTLDRGWKYGEANTRSPYTSCVIELTKFSKTIESVQENNSLLFPIPWCLPPFVSLATPLFATTAKFFCLRYHWSLRCKFASMIVSWTTVDRPGTRRKPLRLYSGNTFAVRL